LCLFLLGVVFLVLGVIGTIQKDLSRAIAFFVLCILTLIPGGIFYYHLIFMQDINIYNLI